MTDANTIASRLNRCLEAGLIVVYKNHHIDCGWEPWPSRVGIDEYDLLSGKFLVLLPDESVDSFVVESEDNV